MNLSLYDLKERGHELIDQVCREKNINRDQVYARLRSRLGCEPYQSHFRYMTSKEQVKRAIIALEQMQGIYRVKKKKNVLPTVVVENKSKKLKNKTLPYSEMKKAIAALKVKKLSWWRRILNHLL